MVMAVRIRYSKPDGYFIEKGRRRQQDSSASEVISYVERNLILTRFDGAAGEERLPGPAVRVRNRRCDGMPQAGTDRVERDLQSARWTPVCRVQYMSGDACH